MPSFDFFQHWYPLLPIEDLEPQKPTTATLLGIPLAIWYSPRSETYQVFLDRCPHRLAPLSEGRIDDQTGNLMCSYHGWQFSKDGACTHIPQADSESTAKNNQLSGRLKGKVSQGTQTIAPNKNLCAKAFPAVEKNDLLWVWMDASCPETAAKTALPLSPKIDASQGFVWSSMVRDLEYDWRTLVENVADPSHVPFAHHGIQGNREKAQPIVLDILQSTIDRIEVETHRPFKTTITFEPPCRLEYGLTFGDESKQVGLITYCLPVAPGKSRIVAQFARNFATKLHHLTPRWWDHLQNRNLILDGDMVLLHQQESLLQNKHWRDVYKMPTSADRLVIEFLKWFDRYCDGQIPWDQADVSNNPQSILFPPREVLLDRYHQHTQHCSSCRTALKTIKLWQWLLLSYFIATISIVAVLPDHLRVSWGLGFMISAIIALGIAAGLRFWLMPKFYFVDYVHSER
ncbi:MAG: Rieske 2Fe-2S domain-containing protein [Cyanobacteria bacterium J06642_3]